ncbi:putative polyketide synthase [Xylariaceae sp. FL1272]|nr:putative polyketide synthase [Xylariaceae sp. FL1272]
MSTIDADSVAIIGLGCRYAGGANGPDALWKMLVEGRDGYSAVPEDRFNWDSFHHPDQAVRGTIVQRGGHFLNQHLGAFDAGFFGISALEAEHMDPLQRLLLEVTWEAVENAGISMDDFKSSETGVFMAMFGHDWEVMTMKDPMMFTYYHTTGVTRTVLSNRLSYVFDLHGPSMTIDTGCSGSLVALNLACQSLRNGETNMALVGGAGVIFSPEQLSLMTQLGIFNKDGRSYSFDSRGSGYGRAEGVGVVALKRLQDAIRDGDEIRSIIRNTNANQDGKTNGITMPSLTGQKHLAAKIFEKLSISPEEIQYVEAHGTGTAAGDLAEVGAIYDMFCKGRNSEAPLLVGSSKPNIGHSEAASGVAGLIKTVLAMEKGFIPPNILLEKMKPGIAHVVKRIKIPQSLEPWPSTTGTRKAVVNNFGSGGTNAQCVLESVENFSPIANGDDHVKSTNGHHNDTNGYVNGTNGHSNTNGSSTDQAKSRLFVLSARSEYSASKGLSDLLQWLKQRRDNSLSVDLDDLSYTLSARRSHFQWRFSLLTPDLDSLIAKLERGDVVPSKSSSRRTNVFVFTGQGAQYFQMGHDLIGKEKTFTESIQKSDDTLKELGASWSLVDELRKDESESLLNKSAYGQPATTAIQVAVVDLLRNWGVSPSAVIGHSSGEVAAAYAAGILTHGTAIRVAFERSFLANAAITKSKYPGAMMAVGLGESEVQEIINTLPRNEARAMVACINSPSSTTVSGDEPAVSMLQAKLQENGTFARLLKVDTAYHSHHMQAVGDEYLARLGEVQNKPPSESSTVRFFSSVSGEEKVDGFGASYWVTNLVSPVKFSQAMESLCRGIGTQDSFNFIEVGPHKALSGPIRQSIAHVNADASLSYRYIPTLVRGQDDCISVMDTGSVLYTLGTNIKIDAVASLGFAGKRARFVKDLPSYAWDHTQIYWREPRLNRDYRMRPHPHHDLLGLKTLTSTVTDPSWRIMLNIQSLPWLRDHVIDQFILFPGAGYMTMAIQAITQLTHDQQPNLRIKSYHLSNVAFKRTLSIPEDPTGVEVILNLRQSETRNGYEFFVSSNPDGEKWLEHSSGHIAIEAQSDLDEVDGGRAEAARIMNYRNKVADARASCSELVNKAELYTELTKAGNQYGPNFSLIEDVRMSTSEAKSLGSLMLPDIRAAMPSGFMQPHIVHPAFLDALLHIGCLLFQRNERTGKGSVVPTFFGDVVISSDIPNNPGEKFEVFFALQTTVKASSRFEVAALKVDGESILPMITMSGGEFRLIGDSHADSDGDGCPQNVFAVQQGLDVSSLTAAHFESANVRLQADEAGIGFKDKFLLLQQAAAHYVHRAVHDVQEGNLRIKDEHARQFAWMSRYCASEQCKMYLSEGSSASKEAIQEKLSGLGAEGDLLQMLGRHLTAILTGEMDSTRLLQDAHILEKLDSFDSSARVNAYMAEYVKHLTFQRRDLRILQIGTSTGASTLALLQQCSPKGGPFCSEYALTNTTTDSLENVRENKLKEWEKLITFKTLDTETDPTLQGFEEHAYDVVLVSNAQFGTESNCAMENIHKLLKPGGTLGIAVAVTSSAWLNTVSIVFPDRWTEEHANGPFQTVTQWHNLLVDSSFSGADQVAYDFPQPDSQYAFLLSTSLSKSQMSGNGHQHGNKKLKIVYTSTEAESSGQLVVTSLHKDLEENNLEVSTQHWQSGNAEDLSGETAYIIVDSASHPFLLHASSTQFDELMSIMTKASSVYWITLSPNLGPMPGVTKSPSHGAILGLARSALNETGGLRFVTVDVQDDLETGDVTHVVKTLSKLITSSETLAETPQTFKDIEYVVKGGKLHISRVVPETQLANTFSSKGANEAKLEDSQFHQADRPLVMQLAQPGIMSSLRFVDNKDIRQDVEIDPNDVEIEMHALSMNFKDVYVALGQSEATQTMVGEGAGFITRVGSNFANTFSVGQKVTVATSRSPYASRTRANGNLVYPIPASMSFNDAATIPVSFATAYYGLIDIARLGKGQSILIHAASGALGQAAIQIAQHIGATIFATVGSTAKAQLLTEKFGIPESHIFSSRTTDFKVNILEITKGNGVDVALNSLSGDALRATWDCIAPLGTFVEVGKTDIYRKATLDMEHFDRNVTFASVDLKLLFERRPETVQSLLSRVFEGIAAGHFAPLPVNAMSISELESAFRFIQSRKHTGKIVLEAGPEAMVKATVPELRLHRDGIYVIAGGLGSIGKHLCKHLQAYGARNIALLTRRDFEVTSRTHLQQELTETPDAKVQILTCDVMNPEEVARMAKELNATSPVKGVIQAAMVVRDHTLAQMTLSEFHAALGVKYHGTLNLASSFTSPGLDFFICLSSVTGIVGLPGVSNYVAGNVFEDTFVETQVSHGNTQFFSINLPLVSETELKSMKQTAGLLTRHGSEVMSIDAVTPVIDYILSGQARKNGNNRIVMGLSASSIACRASNGVEIPPLLSHLYAMSQQGLTAAAGSEVRLEDSIAQASSKEAAEELIVSAIRQKVSGLILIDASEISLDQPMAVLGLDSLVAIELKNWLARALQAPMQTTDIMDAASLKSLATLVAQKSALVTN